MGCCGGGHVQNQVTQKNAKLAKTNQYGPILGPVTNKNYGTFGSGSNFWCQNADVDQLVAAGLITIIEHRL